MPGFFSALRSSAASVTPPRSRRNSTHDDLDDFLHALRSADLILDDDIEKADSELNSRDTPFHLLARATLVFLKATLGFEQAAMKEAREKLATAERVHAAAQASAIKHNSSAWKSDIYDAGTEYAICHAQAQIMAAVLGVLSESVTESVKGFYKVRKAWGTLEHAIAMEKRFLESKGIDQAHPLHDTAPKTTKPDSISSQTQLDSALNSSVNSLKSTNSSTDSFVDCGDDFTPEGTAPSSANTTPPSTNPKTTPKANSPTSPTSFDDENLINTSKIDTDPAQDPLLPYLTNPIDAFIHTAVSTQYGLLLFLASLIPPSFSPFLSILGFRGDRERGLSLLWRSSSGDSIQAGIAAITVVEVYNGLVSFFDIQGKNAWPQARLTELIAHMRQRYPKSGLWQKEEARMCSAERDLETSITMLGGGHGPLGEPLNEKDKVPDPKNSVLRQVKAVRQFERSLDCMYLHAYPLVTEIFQSCIGLNNWSHALYYYIAGCSELELYRIYKHGGYVLSSPAPPRNAEITKNNRAPPSTYVRATVNLEKATQHGKTAQNLFDKAAPASQKKGILGRQLPFDAFISRKVRKWRDHAGAKSLSLVDAIGGSPYEEMNLFWGAHMRMPMRTMIAALRRLAYSDGDYQFLEHEEIKPVDPRAADIAEDDKASVVLLRSILLRRIGMLERGDGVRNGPGTADTPNPKTESEALSFAASPTTASFVTPTNNNLVEAAAFYLKESLLDTHPWASFKVHSSKNGDIWALPMATYEFAASLWSRKHEIEEGDETIPDPDHEGVVLSLPKLRECVRLLEEVSKWESYDLDVRMGLKVSSARGTLKRMGVKAAEK